MTKTALPTLLLSIAAATTTLGAAAEDIPSKAGEPCRFTEGVRYSELVINSRINDFRANTTQSGFGVFDSEGHCTETPRNAKATLDYVPGLVAKAIVEAVDYYKDNSTVNVAPWFYAVEYYANRYDIASDGKQGRSFDDLNAVKLYFKLRELAASCRFADGETYGNASTAATAEQRFADAREGIILANSNYAIKASTLQGAAGGWWHKHQYTDQMWCDGQYMGPALLAQMMNEYEGYAPVSSDDWTLVTRQFAIAWDYLWDDDVRLLYHAFTADPGGQAAKDWAGVKATPGAEVYHSAEFWGRAVGWYFMALVDVLEQMEQAGQADTANYTQLHSYLQQLAAGIAAKQDAATGCWYQLLNHDGSYVATTYSSRYRYTAEPVANYLESSATALFVAAYLKGMRLGLLGSDYRDTALKGYRGFVNRFMVSDGQGGVHLVGCCKSAGLGGSNYRDGSAEYYLMGKDTEPTSTSGSNFYTEGKVFGAFIMAALEYERLMDSSSSGVGTLRMDGRGNDLNGCFSWPDGQPNFMTVVDLSGRRLKQDSRQALVVRHGQTVLSR